MALLEWEDFGEGSFVPGWWSNGQTGWQFLAGGPFSRGQYIRSDPSANEWIYRYSGFANTQTIWMQGWINPRTIFLSRVFVLTDGVTEQCSLEYYGTTGTFRVLRGGSTLIATTSGHDPIPLQVWHFVQWKVTISNTVGTAEIWVDGKMIGSFTGLNIRNTANNYVNGFGLGGYDTWHANVLLYDETGADPNARTGEVEVISQLPTAAGDSTGWTPSAGANYQCVDDTPGNDGDTTYNAAAAAVTDDLYTFPSVIPAGSVVLGVGVVATVRKDDAGTNEVDPIVKSGGTIYSSGSVYPLSTTYQRFRRLWQLDPNTGSAFTVANANAVQTGIRRTS